MFPIEVTYLRAFLASKSGMISPYHDVGI